MAVEGLPGAGKTTFIADFTRHARDTTVLPELCLPPPPVPSRSFFVRNDTHKASLQTRHDSVLMDRFWASTACYVRAEARLQGRAAPARVDDTFRGLYGSRPPSPDAVVFLDATDAVETATATDGAFGDRRFRVLLRQAYFEVLTHLALPLLIAPWGATEQVERFVHAHLATPPPSIPGRDGHRVG